MQIASGIGANPELQRRILAGESYSQLAREFNCSRQRIYQIHRELLDAEKITRYCRGCGVELKFKKGLHYFCSPECYREYRSSDSMKAKRERNKLIEERILAGVPYKEIAKEFNLGERHISYLARKKLHIWRHAPRRREVTV